jgi:hypothetical protein
MGEDKIIGRISRSLAEGEVVDGLTCRLIPSDLQSLMLHVYRRRSAQRSPADLVAQYERNAMVRPSTADPRALVEIERMALEAAAGFEAVDLSPVAPLGLNRVLGRIDQNNCLATVRNAEVMADPTTAKALECARRRRAGEKETIKLCSRSRQLRLQPFDSPAFSPHFDLFSMVSAGRDRGGLTFEIESLREHIGVFLELLNRLTTLGYRFEEITVNVSDTARDSSRLARAEERARAQLLQRLVPGPLRDRRLRCSLQSWRWRLHRLDSAAVVECEGEAAGECGRHRTVCETILEESRVKEL